MLFLSLSGGKLFFFRVALKLSDWIQTSSPDPPDSLPAIFFFAFFFVVVAVVVWMLSLFRFRVSFFSSL
jgi:hypothetical protein